MLTKAQRSERARIAALARHHKDDPSVVDARRTEFKTRRLEEYVKRVMESDPPLTPEQRRRVAQLLLKEA